MSESATVIPADWKPAQEFYESIAADYAKLFTDAESLAENQTVFDLIGLDMWEDERILDLGSGPGTLLDYVNVPPSKYLGVDISAKMVTLAQIRHPGHRFWTADVADDSALASAALRLGITGVGFVVSTFGVLSYVEDLSAVLKSIANLLDPKGKLFFMVYKDGYTPQTHESFGQSVPHKTYTMQQIRDLIEPDWKRGMVLDLGDFVAGVGLELEERTSTQWLGL